MNSWYLVFSGLLESGDWAVVISGLDPAWAWRLGMATAGGAAYAASVRVAARAAAEWVGRGEVSIDDLRRLTVSSYVAGGVLLVLASALNPVELRLVLVSGVGASFGLTWGLLLIPGMVASRMGGRPAAEPTVKALPLQPFWVAAAVLVGVAFVCVLGPGIRLSR
jgi:hypothetical protein